MRILILGGTRFIGPHVVRALRGHDVTVLHRTDCGDASHIHADRSAASGAWDAVIDMIAMSEEDTKAWRSLGGPLVVISSADVYRQYDRVLGRDHSAGDETPLAEDAPLRKNLFPYGGTYEKILVERAARERGATILRLPAVYGPGDARLREWINATVPMTTLQRTWRWTRGYVENVAGAIALAALHPNGRTYNVGEPDAPAEEEWVAMLGGRVVDGDGPPYDFRFDLVTDTGAIRRDLGYVERVARTEAIRRTISSGS
jgi:nucleoside-diphosphate-sugar epimerase